MKTMALLSLLMLTSCTTLTVLCRHVAPAQYDAAAEVYGGENVQLWRMLNKPGAKYTYHMQVKVMVDNEWLWLDNNPYTMPLTRSHNAGCTPYKRLK